MKDKQTLEFNQIFKQATLFFDEVIDATCDNDQVYSLFIDDYFLMINENDYVLCNDDLETVLSKEKNTILDLFIFMKRNKFRTGDKITWKMDTKLDMICVGLFLRKLDDNLSEVICHYMNGTKHHLRLLINTDKINFYETL